MVCLARLGVSEKRERGGEGSKWNLGRRSRRTLEESDPEGREGRLVWGDGDDCSFRMSPLLCGAKASGDLQSVKMKDSQIEGQEVVSSGGS